MNTDIRIKIDLPNHIKYKRLKRFIQESPMEYLINFWGYVAKHVPTGQLIGWQSDEIEDISGWDGDPGVFCAALITVGFLDKLDNGFEPHDWSDHQTWVVKAPERSAAAKKAIKSRWEKRSIKQDVNTEPIRGVYDTNTESMSRCNTECNTPSPLPSPLPLLKDKESSCADEPHPLKLIQRKRRIPSGDQQKFFVWWQMAFQEIEGSTYIFTGKDQKHIQSLLQGMSFKELIWKASGFLMSQDQFLEGKKDLGMMLSQVNKLPKPSTADLPYLRSIGLAPPEGMAFEEWNFWEEQNAAA